jgi:glycosyltransferase involved in cell wall biosynthesis
MKHALYITCYNHPAMLDRLLKSGLLAGVDRDQWDVILFDQSDQLAFQNAYEEQSEALNCERVQNRNQGASEAKRRQIEHAYGQGRELMAQISEDFILTPDGAQRVYWLPNGREVFFAAAQDVLRHRPHLAFCCWTFAMDEGSPFWYDHLARVGDLKLHKVSRLAHAEGDVLALGWPYTAKVHEMMKLVVEARKPAHAADMRGVDGGEGIMAMASRGKGACLLAQPVIHDRKPEQRPDASAP